LKLEKRMKKGLNIMTRRQALRVLLPNTVSHAVMDYAGHPFLFEIELDARYAASIDPAPMGANQALSFLARVHLWIRLALGLETVSENPHRDFTKFKARRIHHKQVDLKAIKRAPAFNLAGLMRFAPDAAGLGLTLNQYRERFTRLSVLGRVAIYWQFLRRSMRRRRLVHAIRLERGAMCGAILRPD
jgi:hypothetical protein